jgi:hypothetical protein
MGSGVFRMKVKDLIKKLQECDQEALVVFDYEWCDAKVEWVTETKWKQSIDFPELGLATDEGIEKCVYLE